MGKAIPKQVKSRARTLLELYPTKFSESFEDNKKFLRSLALPFSKTEGNLMQGYLVRLIKAARKARERDAIPIAPAA